jgi:hypothetical protein
VFLSERSARSPRTGSAGCSSAAAPAGFGHLNNDFARVGPGSTQLIVLATETPQGRDQAGLGERPGPVSLERLIQHSQVTAGGRPVRWLDARRCAPPGAARVACTLTARLLSKATVHTTRAR